MPFISRPRFVNRTPASRFISQEFPQTVVPNLTKEDEDRLMISTPSGTNLVPGFGMNSQSASVSTSLNR